MSTLTVFNFESHEVRTVLRNGEVWFVASDVCKALGYANTSKAIGDHLDDDEKDITTGYTPGGDQKLSIISESGLYALVLRSRKPEARKFAKWVTREVLPAIRKTGTYAVEGWIDVEDLLLSGQSAPSLPLPPDLAQELERRAWEMAGQAYLLLKGHLQRRIAFTCEQGSPRYLNVAKAYEALREGDLGYALAHGYYEQVRRCESLLNCAQLNIARTLTEIAKQPQPADKPAVPARRAA